ncbi:hypothetical protein EBESD8_55400 [Rhodococcus aetherivorans]|nr:hypothetical protein EBESD8_55400 [Rhodococcus aetherivorans]
MSSPVPHPRRARRRADLARWYLIVAGPADPAGDDGVRRLT